MQAVHAALPGKPVAILEAGWASVAIEFGDRASEAKQARYYRELKKWAADTNTTVFFFEAFDEPWKGNPNNPLGAEKHWACLMPIAHQNWCLEKFPLLSRLSIHLKNPKSPCVVCGFLRRRAL